MILYFFERSTYPIFSWRSKEIADEKESEYIDSFKQIESLFLWNSSFDASCSILNKVKEKSLVFKRIELSGSSWSELEFYTDPSFYLNNDWKLLYK